MENKYGVVMKRDLELPPGFRFHPTDEELITHYLWNKVLDSSFSALAIGEVDMNKVEPWELPWRAKLGEKEWYFFCIRDRKYPSGQRTNRATASGYWKATGKDKQIYRGKTLVGMRKTLVFYRGRAPKGQKTSWVAHEYRLEADHKSLKSSKNDWVISRVFHKTSSGKKVHISGLIKMDWEGNETSNVSTMLVKPEREPGHVHCFSRPVTPPQKIQQGSHVTYFDDPVFRPASNPVDPYPPFALSSFPGLVPFQEPTFFRIYEQNLNHEFRQEETETENSYVVSNLEMGKALYEDGSLPTSDCIWS